MNNARYYQQQLRRPSWAPPARIFAPVWTFLYAIIAISFGTVFLKALHGALPFLAVLPFLLNLAFNAAYTTIQFRLKSNVLGAIDIVLILGTLVWLMVSIFAYVPWVAIANIPYLLWVAFATVLQFTIAAMNR